MRLAFSPVSEAERRLGASEPRAPNLAVGPLGAISGATDFRLQMPGNKSESKTDGTLEIIPKRESSFPVAIPARSRGAQAAIDQYAPDPPPNNNSDNTLHADHVYPLTEVQLYDITSLDTWIVELTRLDAVICGRARENWALEVVEKAGITGPKKYVKAGIEFVRGPLPWDA